MEERPPSYVRVAAFFFVPAFFHFTLLLFILVEKVKNNLAHS